jgi:hypothetical protein
LRAAFDDIWLPLPLPLSLASATERRQTTVPPVTSHAVQVEELRRAQARVLIESGIAEKAIVDIRAARSKTNRDVPNEVLPLVVRSTRGSDSSLLVGLRLATRRSDATLLSHIGQLSNGAWVLASQTAGYSAEDLRVLVELADEAARTLTAEELELGC